MCFLKALNQGEAVKPMQVHQKIEFDPNQNENYQKQVQKSEKNHSDVLKEDNQETEEAVPLIMPSVFEMQFQLIKDLIIKNNLLALHLLEKNQQMEYNLESLESMMLSFKKSKDIKIQEKTTKFIKLQNSNYGDCLIQKLFTNTQYRYELVLDQPFNTQLYKERNFDIHVKLVDIEQNLILNSNPIPISFCVYNSEIDPEIIQTNKCGQPVLKGNSESEIYHGRAEFKKLHLREVTSYYTNGWIYLMVFPKAPSFSYNNKQSNLETVIDYTQVKPLVISEVVIRAKKK